MIKTITLFRGIDSESYDDFHARIRKLIDLIIQQTNPQKLSYTITVEAPPKGSVIPFQKSRIAVISVYNEDGFDPHGLMEKEGFAGSYQVTEAFPIKYEGEITRGMKMPGVCLLTLFRQKKGISYEKFLHRWHNGHSPLTLKIHPIYHYNRNTIDQTLGEGPVHYDGIVEEHCKTASELFNPFKFFGKPWMAPVNMIRVYVDVRSFLDYSSIESYLVSEFHVL